MRMMIVVQGAELAPIPYEVRRYVCRDADHAEAVLNEMQPAHDYTAWRITSVDRSVWYWAFATETYNQEKLDLVESLDDRAEKLGAVHDPSLDAADAMLLVRRRLMLGFEAVAAGLPKAHTELHFDGGAVIDPATGALEPYEAVHDDA